ncbi:hypothetical protein [Desulfofustis limnaeus]|uniref:Uncharacterized protein n=1 Tax=Desulfofustis limnaeus TaxID=2740163 RepID=A0ABN6MAN8_9BACT|nr:hypothetical protein [Desulfofustis limnaeus]BDD88881.1 hypothetical protein DPPLL_32460 [Desulfofustis limnaeus]
MRTNVDLMREKLEKLKIRQTSLRVEAKGIARDIPALINPALVDLEEMDVTRAAAKMDDLVVRQAELLQLRARIWELEEALGQ